ncbi:MAG: hypothetical protein A3I91_01960 [Candidatus Kerfeldbacteria bacterium RIFCSPLOWO2_02_FULL_42_19]|nr:MAG: hypothetical protein A3I91_01960 [Candidatus Kerfeldbacteria bacterium RIFCSPLOWO2_02_FULL_42_19]OGY85481.1 MAG: hypothetical protein A3G01_03545 [Candidatus Kerfeldbacteria bacterium RIFCSPLOWO2_12_FULL_43_9]
MLKSRIITTLRFESGLANTNRKDLIQFLKQTAMLLERDAHIVKHATEDGEPDSKWYFLEGKAVPGNEKSDDVITVELSFAKGFPEDIDIILASNSQTK